MHGTESGVPVVEIPGAILISGFFHSFLLGIVMTQAVKYWGDYRDDSRMKRAFIALIILLSILQTALEDYKAWRTTISRRFWSTSSIQWSDFFLNGWISSLCEGFFIRRCWKIMGKKLWVALPLSILLITVSVANLYLAIAMGVTFDDMQAGVTNDTLASSKNILISTVVAFSYWIFGSLVLDITVATTSVISLWKSKTGLTELDQVVQYIIVITLESAALPCICMLIAVGLYHANPHVKDHLVLFFVFLTGKLYTLGMLRTLNSRAKLRERMKSHRHHLGRTSLRTQLLNSGADSISERESRTHLSSPVSISWHRHQFRFQEPPAASVRNSNNFIY